jgi:hypothetical protein
LQAEKEKVSKADAASTLLLEKHEMDIERIKSALEVDFKITDINS